MSWDRLIYFALAALLLWTGGALAAWKERSRTAFVATSAGLAIFFSFIILMWVSLERPPLRTMGETRLWYSFFLPLAGLLVYSRWKYKWILCQFIQTRDSFQDTDASTAKPLVRTTRHRLHVCLRPLGSRHSHGGVSAVCQERANNGRGNGDHRQPRICGTGLLDHRHAFRSLVGQRSVGTLLVMGPQRDLGGHHLVRLSGLYSLSVDATSPPPSVAVDAHRRVPFITNLLVGN